MKRQKGQAKPTASGYKRPPLVRFLYNGNNEEERTVSYAATARLTPPTPICGKGMTIVSFPKTLFIKLTLSSPHRPVEVELSLVGPESDPRVLAKGRIHPDRTLLMQLFGGKTEGLFWDKGRSRGRCP